jgi:hypothetical protein
MREPTVIRIWRFLNEHPGPHHYTQISQAVEASAGAVHNRLSDIIEGKHRGIEVERLGWGYYATKGVRWEK